jgi:tetratricopeptide (TPR) repeat protein
MIDVDAVIRHSKELCGAAKCYEAIEFLTEAITECADARVYYARGRAFYIIGKPEQAVVDFSTALQLDPSNPHYLFYRACTLSHSLQRDKEAIDDFERVIEQEPTNIDAHRECCLCLLTVGDVSRALEHATIARELAPDDALTHFSMGEVKASLKQFNDATESFTRAVELDSEKAHYWAALARSHRNLGGKVGLELAEQAYSRAVQLAPDSALFFYSRGQVRLELGMMSDAKADFGLGHGLAHL